jgi:hypothetical protein
MDYYRLNKNALLIPTPGQGEQEYLAQNLLSQNKFYSVEQKNLRLPQDLATANTYGGFNRDQQKDKVTNWDELFRLF